MQPSISPPALILCCLSSSVHSHRCTPIDAAQQLTPRPYPLLPFHCLCIPMNAPVASHRSWLPHSSCPYHTPLAPIQRPVLHEEALPGDHLSNHGPGPALNSMPCSHSTPLPLPLQLLYNDLSPMENHHLAASFQIMAQDQFNFLARAPPQVCGGHCVCACGLPVQVVHSVLCLCWQAACAWSQDQCSAASWHVRHPGRLGDTLCLCWRAACA